MGRRHDALIILTKRRGNAMKVEFLTQPDTRVGDLIDKGIATFGLPRELIMVSAFASLPTVLRLRSTAAAIKAGGGEVSLVIGIDLGGTSREVLKEISDWTIPIIVVKNRLPGITFHPKIYLLRWPERAEIIVGSNNLTEGGFYRNYEAASRTTYTLPAEADIFAQARAELQRFLRPSGPTASQLTPAYLASLLALPEIPSETIARRLRGEETAPGSSQNQGLPIFGYEKIPAAPYLPPDLRQRVIITRKNLQKDLPRTRGAVSPSPPNVQLTQHFPSPSAFYMTLATMRGPNNPTIPGEQRIPLAAIQDAEHFWGWPGNYQEKINPRLGARAKTQSVYRSWSPTWRIASTDNPLATVTRTVRMYMYVNSSDFRFYAGGLIQLGAKGGDIIQLRRVDEPAAVFECMLARQGTPQYLAWLPYLSNAVRGGNSTRRFGFV
jgi:hypothetical protein